MREMPCQRPFTEPCFCGSWNKSTRVSAGPMMATCDLPSEFWIFSVSSVSPSTRSSSCASTSPTRPCSSSSTNSSSSSSRPSTRRSKSSGPSSPSLTTRIAWTPSKRARSESCPCLTTNAGCHEVAIGIGPSGCSSNGSPRRIRTSPRTPASMPARSSRPRRSFASVTSPVSSSTGQKPTLWKRTRTKSRLPRRTCLKAPRPT
mmetsp:Transcript_1364/g.3359  ORF Transcript_1364/g.3359 Transcript_1364/m.3359 type:complete len:203 (+) Transcript_1364:1572-2180(+)